MARYLGIDTHNNLFYEGNFPYGRAIWPSPVVVPATISSEEDISNSPGQSNDSLHVVCQFREDHYDPVSRIRRGRFYFRESNSIQPRDWSNLEAHPAVPSEIIKSRHLKTLTTFVKQSIWHTYTKSGRELPLVLLGVEERCTIWKVVNIEVTASGEELVTLKARSNFGLLPKLDIQKIPPAMRKNLTSTLDAFVDDVHRAAPLSVIDRARDAASYILLSYFNLSGETADDLGQLVKKLEAEPQDGFKVVAISAAKIIQRLHARGKPVEQEKRRPPPIHEQDAELAAQCVGALIFELGLGAWQ